MRLPLAAKKLMGSNTYADVSFWKIFFTNLKTIQIFIKWESKEGGRSLTVCSPIGAVGGSNFIPPPPPQLVLP